MKAIRFLGHSIARHEHPTLMSVINMAHLGLGKSKRNIKTEVEFWEPLDRVYGFKPFAGDPFMVAVRRAHLHLRSMSPEERQVARSVVGLGEETFPPLVRAAKAAQVTKKPKAGRVGPTPSAKSKFYDSWEWRTLRMKVLKEHGRACQCCGAKPGQLATGGEPARIVVDHIKPISKFWDLRLDQSNLQVLCDECNQGKGAWDETDWRGTNVLPFPKRASA